jgi:hypothetical protein
MALNACRARRSLPIAAALLCVATLCQGDSLGFADELPAAVPPRRSAPLPLTVAADADTPVHRIVIPKAVLAKLAGDLPDVGTIGSAFPSRSIVAAFALSAAVACGLVVSRRGRPGRLAATLIFGLVAAGAAGLLPGMLAPEDTAVADLAFPREKPLPRPAGDRPDSVVLAQGGKVILEIAAGGEEAVVIVVGKPGAK